MAKTLAEIKAAMQKELEEEQKRLEREEGKRFSSSQTSGNSSSGKTSNNTQSSAQSSAAVAQAKANKEADLIGAKDSAKLNSFIEKVPAKSSAAEKAKNSSASGGNLGTSKQAVGDFIAKAAGAQEGIDKIEAAKTEKAAAQAKANKEKDLLGFDGHAYQQQLAQQKEEEKVEYLNIKEARDRKYVLEQELEKAKAQAKEETAKAGTVQIVASGRKGANNSFVSPETQKRIDELEKEISDLNKNINLASRKQEGKYLYKSAVNAEDFDKYSKEAEKEKQQKSAVPFKQANQERETETVKAFMTEEQKAVYNYYLNKFGEEKAEEYFDSIREELNKKQAQAIFAGNEGKVLNEYIQGVAAGLENSKEGYQSFLNMILGIENPQPTSTMDFVSQMAREDLANAGFKLPEALGGSSIGQIGFDFTNTTANMLPSLVLGTLGGAGIGAAAIGASAAGNAYNSAITEGYSKEQATNYAALVGASEAALGYVLGGIEATGGKISKAVLGKVLPKIDNALAKAAVNVGGKMLSEFSEEYLQEVLSPVFENIALMEENEIDLLSPEAIYSGILGALSAGGMAFVDGSLNVPEVLQKAEVPVPFEGKAQPGTEAAIIADKISEIENRPISEAEKAAKIEEVMEAVKETEGLSETEILLNETEKFKNIHEERAEENNKYLRNPSYDMEKGDYVFGDDHGNRRFRKDLIIEETQKDNEFLGEKSPFREGFKEWIQNNKTSINPVIVRSKNILPESIKFSDISAFVKNLVKKGDFFRGIAKNNYSGFEINVSSKGLNETAHNAQLQKNKASVEALQNVKELVENAVLIGAHEVEVKYPPTKKRNPEKLYQYIFACPYIKNGTENVAIIRADRIYDGDNTIRNFYNLKSIEIVATNPESRLSRPAGNAATIYSIADLAKAVNAEYVGAKENLITKKDVFGPEIVDKIFGIENSSGLYTPPSIGNNVFGAENFDNKNIFNNKENDVVTETFEKMAAEAVSAEISDSARRVVEQMKERPSVQKSVHEFEQSEAEIEPVKVPQSKKSERIERRYQKAVEDGVASVFGIDRRDIKNDIRPLLNEIAADVKDGKTITDEQIDALYKKAFDDGYISEEFPQYQELRKYVREKPFYVSPETRHEFGDDEAFREFARENFGNFKVSTDPRDRSLDDFYKTMAEMAPEFFTEGETDPRTQLEDISDFMNQTKKQYFGLSEVYSGTELADFEAWAKKELKAYMDEFGKGLDNVRRYELDRQIKATNKAREMDTTASFEQAKAAFEGNRVFEAKRAVEKAKANQLLDENEEIKVRALLAGTINEADVIALGGNVEGILEVYNAEKAYRAARAPFDKYKAAYKTALQHDAIELTALSDEWTDKTIGFLYSRETAERNVKDIAGKSAGKIIEEYFTPVHENEAMKTRWIKELNQRVADLELGRMNRWERAYAQMIGENAAYIAEGRMTKHDQNEHDVLNERISALLDKHGKKIDKAKCEKAAAGLMGIYEDILEEWNDERIRRGQEPLGKIQNYFPHFTETRPENTIQKIFSFFGFDIGNSKLPTDIAGRTEDRKPQSKYNPHAQRRTTDVTDYDIFKGFDGYVRAVGDNIFHTEDIQKLRILSDIIRTKYSSAEIEKRIEKIRNNHTLDLEDQERLIAEVWKDVPGAYHLSHFVVWLDNYTNLLAGKKHRGDREAEYNMGREIYDISKALEGRIASNMIGYNLSTPVMNLVPMFQAVADVPPQDILSSFVQTGLAAAKGDSFISDNSDFLTNRFGVDSVYKKNYGLFTSENIKDAFAKISDGGAFLMEFVDRVVSESLVRARYEQNIKKGMDKVSAFSEADSWAAGLIADRSTGALPTVFGIKNPVAKSFTMFQVEVNNQYSYIFKDAGKYKWKTEGALNTITGQLAFWAAMAICNGLADELLGRDNVVPDPLGMSAEALAKIAKGEPVGEVVWDTGMATLEQLPFIGGVMGGGRLPLSTALPDGEQVVKFFDKDIPWDKRKNILGEEILKPLSYFFLPSGAGQAWKTGKGVKQLIEGGAFGTENDGSVFMKFPQEYDPESIIKTLLFGQYASDRGQEYIDSGFKGALSAKQTEQMELAEEYGLSKREFYDVILGLRPYDKNEEKQEAILQNEDLDAREKSIIDWILFGDGKGFPESTRDYTSEQAFWESGLSDSQIRLNEDGYSREEIRLIEYAFEKGKDKVSTIEWIQKTMDCTEAEAYEIYQRRQGKWIDDPGKLNAEQQARAKGAAELYGMSEENFLNVLNYSNFGAVKDGEYSDKKEDVIKQLMKANSWSEEKAEELYNRVNLYEYSREDLEDAKVKELQTSQEWYGVDDKGYFVARNVIKTAEGTTDKYGNTVSGSKKEAAVKEIAKQLGIDETEATIYYLAANGDLVLSEDDLSSSQIEDMKAAVAEGWTERQFLDAVNLLKVSGATKKDDIIKTLMDGGASYEMAQGFYNLRQNKDYDRTVSTGGSSGAGYSYGMKTQKQADKGDYFLANYNSDGSLSAKDIAKWYAAAAGCNKKQEYLDAYQSAGATYSQALQFYNLMRGYDQSFNNYYKQKG